MLDATVATVATERAIASKAPLAVMEAVMEAVMDKSLTKLLERPEG